MRGMIFSSHGIRGIFGQELTSRAVLAISTICGGIFGTGSSVVLGRDTRESGPVLERAALAGLMSSGVRVLNAGVVTTPLLSWAVKRLGADGAVMITASHNPPEWNGLKVLRGDGGLIEPEQMKLVEKAYSEGELSMVDWEEVGEEVRVDGLIGMYRDEAVDLVNAEAIGSAGIRAVVDPNGGAASLVAPSLLSKLGVKVLTINGVPGHFSREIEPRPEALGRLAEVVDATGADVGFAYDSDGDRLTLVAEGGEVLREDLSLALVMDRILEEKGGGTAVVNVASSMVFDDIARNRGATLVRTMVGEFFVVREMLRLEAVAGGEGSCGGIILPKFHLGRDGALAAAKIVEIMAEKGKGIGELVGEFPEYGSVRRDIDIGEVDWEGSRTRLEKLADELGMQTSLIDGVRLEGEGCWVLARPSRGEPLLRVMAEAQEEGIARDLVERVVSALSR